MAISLLAHVADAGPHTFTTDAIDTTGATLLVVAFSFYNTAPSSATLSDSKSNTWTPLSEVSSPHTLQFYYAENPTVGSGHTFTATDDGNERYMALQVAAFAGILTVNPFDVDNSNEGNPVTSLQPGSVTPAQNNSLLYTALSNADSISSLSINGGFTIIDEVSFASGVTFALASAYLIQGTPAATNPTWSWSTSVPALADIVVFTGSAVTTRRGRLLLLGVGS